MNDHKKIIFLLEQDEDGYPPARAEGVWAKEQPDGRFVIANIPFYARAATVDDVVEAEIQDGELRYKGTVRHSGNSLIRVILCEGTDPDALRKQLEDLGCSTESFNRLMAVNIPPTVPLHEVRAMLQQGEKEDKWGCEEPLLMQCSSLMTTEARGK